jgi:DNA-binding transcriptional regulator YiaG
MTEQEEVNTTICSNCGAEATLREGAYRFSECGLTNVTLKGIGLIECHKCDNVDPIIPDVNDLMRALAWHLATQKYRLSGEDVRFLRKYLKMSGVDFAKLLGVDKSTLSKWENDDDPIGTANERLIRSVTLALGDGLKERSEEGIRTFTWITEEYHNGPVNVDMETLEVENA